MYGDTLLRLCRDEKTILPLKLRDNAIHWISLYPLDSVVGFPDMFLLDSDLSGIQRFNNRGKVNRSLYLRALSNIELVLAIKESPS